MKRKSRLLQMKPGFAFAALVLLLAAPGLTSADDSLKGWEAGSAYDQLYDPSDWDKLKGVCLDFEEVVPMPGMAEGIAMVMRSRDDEIVNVHLGPKAYIARKSVGVRKGDEIKVKGVWVVIDDKDVFIASKVKKGEYFEFKMRRTRDGKPYWSMTPAELAAQTEE